MGGSFVSTATSSSAQLAPDSLTDERLLGNLGFCFDMLVPSPLSLALLFLIFFKSEGLGEIDFDLEVILPLL